MNKSEKRILFLEVSPDCKALRVCGEPVSEQVGKYCNKNGRWERIKTKDCKKCKSPILAGISRAEAVERMGEAFIKYDRERDKSKPLDPYEAMQAALDALLGKEEGRNGDN